MFAAATSAPRLLHGGALRHPFLAYVLLAWASSGSYWLWMAARGDVVTPGGPISHVPGLFGPMLSAFVVTGLVAGRNGLRDLLARMFRWRVAARWYALAALPLLLFLVGVGVGVLGGGNVPTIEEFATYSGLPTMGLPAVVLAAFVANGYGEEVGWRGFAQPTLERQMGFLRASVVVAIVWALWHVPALPIVESYRQMGLAVLPMFVFGLGSGAIVLGWLYDRSGGSILIASLWHLGLNMGSATLAGRGLPAAVATTGVMVWAALIVISELRRGRAAAPRPTRSAGRSGAAALRDASLRLLLTSRLRGLVGSSVALLSYRGRRTGNGYATPVEVVRDGTNLLVLVANADRKQWWRNVERQSAVGVILDGRSHPATATVEIGAAAEADVQRYLAVRPRAARAIAGQQPVIVRLAVA